MNPERDAIMNLADRVRRLAPSHRDPEKFHVEKDEIERALRRLAVGKRSRPPVEGAAVGRMRVAGGRAKRIELSDTREVLKPKGDK
jgi:hypothetical protein